MRVQDVVLVNLVFAEVTHAVIEHVNLQVFPPNDHHDFSASNRDSEVRTSLAPSGFRTSLALAGFEDFTLPEYDTDMYAPAGFQDFTLPFFEDEVDAHCHDCQRDDIGLEFSGRMMQCSLPDEYILKSPFSSAHMCEPIVVTKFAPAGWEDYTLGVWDMEEKPGETVVLSDLMDEIDLAPTGTPHTAHTEMDILDAKLTTGVRIPPGVMRYGPQETPLQPKSRTVDFLNKSAYPLNLLVELNHSGRSPYGQIKAPSKNSTKDAANEEDSVTETLSMNDDSYENPFRSLLGFDDPKELRSLSITQHMVDTFHVIRLTGREQFNTLGSNTYVKIAMRVLKYIYTTTEFLLTGLFVYPMSTGGSEISTNDISTTTSAIFIMVALIASIALRHFRKLLNRRKLIVEENKRVRDWYEQCEEYNGMYAV